MLPVVYTQLVDDVNTVGAPQRSFAGASFTHILKPHCATVPAATLDPFVNTRTRYVLPGTRAVAGSRFKVALAVALAQLLELAFKVVAIHEVVLNSCNLGASSILEPMPLNRIVGK